VRRALAAGIALALLAAPSRASVGQHEVRPGETLERIAGRTLGDASLWPAIYLANRDRIKDPERVYPGQLLRIPSVAEGERDAVRREAEALQRPGPHD
jgi:nucleoid-associated protein YgaU